MIDVDRLVSAFALKTPADSVRLYRDWARDYDETFAEAYGYIAPREVASTFRAEAARRPHLAVEPILDIGAGTGLLAAELAGMAVDAIDISREMLDVAGAKGLYRRCILADLTETLPIWDETYSGFVSTGTFTHGHLGPCCLGELLRIARSGALFTLAINPGVFDDAGFGSAFAALVARDVIEPVDFHHLDIYEDARHAHAEDRYLTAVFRKR